MATAARGHPGNPGRDQVGTLAHVDQGMHGMEEPVPGCGVNLIADLQLARGRHRALHPAEPWGVHGRCYLGTHPRPRPDVPMVRDAAYGRKALLDSPGVDERFAGPYLSASTLGRVVRVVPQPFATTASQRRPAATELQVDRYL